MVINECELRHHQWNAGTQNPLLTSPHAHSSLLTLPSHITHQLISSYTGVSPLIYTSQCCGTCCYLEYSDNVCLFLLRLIFSSLIYFILFYLIFYLFFLVYFLLSSILFFLTGVPLCGLLVHHPVQDLGDLEDVIWQISKLYPYWKRAGCERGKKRGWCR